MHRNGKKRLTSRILAGIILLASGISPAPASDPDNLQLAYLASFGHSLAGSVDRLYVGALTPGNSGIANIDATWAIEKGTALLGVTRPATYVGGPVASGIFATPVNFGGGSLFGVRATFRAPTGPHLTGNQFAVALNARTGGAMDLQSETRVAATFRVRGTGAGLNVFGATVPPNLPNIPQELYDAIFDPVDPAPFTIELLMDRRSGIGTATLSIRDFSLSYDFESAFKANSGPTITALGPTIAVSNGPDQRATVQVTDFRVLIPKSSVNPAAAGCEPGWAAFGCRMAPSE